jgi:thioredoxin 2
MATQALPTTIVQCEHCGKKNRVPAAGPSAPQCGNCHNPLPWIVEATDDTFAEIVEQSPVPVLLDMWAPWCGPCRMVTPALERVARDLAGRIKLAKVNVDESPAISQRFEIQAIPTLMMVRDGKVIARQAGAAPADALRRWVEGVLGSQSSPRS